MAFVGVSILLVDDYAPWRRHVSSMLKEDPGLQVVCEAEDGLDAVDKAEELQPDLILLDIGLPTLNGLEAARRIRTRAPKSRIIFVSQESSSDIAQAAMTLGEGYVVKFDAAADLLRAVHSVLQGGNFVGTERAGLDLAAEENIEGNTPRNPNAN